MVRSTSKQYTNVATKVPSATWLAVSRMKLRSSVFKSLPFNAWASNQAPKLAPIRTPAV
jgi:hypothetical protein